MPCYSPLTGWRSRRRNPSGKYSITFIKSEGYADQEFSLPCGKCIGCRIEHSQQWAARCMHEASQFDRNCFITLTYSDDVVPTVFTTPTLRKKDVQDFMKRLRKEYGEGIRYYGCGEYGENTKRPHYHLCLFNHDFDDKEIVMDNGEYKVFNSQKLDKIWGKGFTTIGEMNYQSAAYTARYCLKKFKGKDWQKHYEVINQETGEILSIEPEFALMSRRPGIGRDWYEKFKKELIDNDSVIVNSNEAPVPRYYSSLIQKEDPKTYEKIKNERREAVKKAISDYSLARLHVRGIVKQAQVKQLKKEL